MKNIYYDSDRPIISCEEDVLGRSNFAKKLAGVLLNGYNKEGIVVGLFGEWGSGKTSLINLTIDENEKNKNDSSNKKKAMVVKFEPWNYSDGNDLIVKFFNLLKQSIEKKEYKELKEAIGDILEEYISCLDVLNTIPYVGNILSFLTKRGTRKVANKLKQKDSLEVIKQKMEYALKLQNTRIIVVIDDIDRLSSKQIRDVFQLVKSVGAFSNVTYVLLMERKVVEKALEDVQEGDGREYLEKIIQIPIEIPQMQLGHLYLYFSKQLDCLLEQYEGIVVNTLYWNAVFSDCIRPFLKSIRDVKRIINVLSFKLSIISEEVSIEDLVAITVIEIMEPNLYKWIYENRNILCSKTIKSSLIDADTAKREEQKYLSIFHNLIKCGEISNIVDENQVIKIISALFPPFENRIGKLLCVNDDGTDVVQKMRISNPNRIDIYYRYDLSDWSFTRKELEDIIREKNESEIIDFLNRLSSEASINLFLEELKAIDSTIPQERYTMFMHLMLIKQLSLVNEEVGLWFKNSDRLKAEAIFDDLFMQLSSYQRFLFMKDEICGADCALLEGIGLKLSELLGAYGMISDRKENPAKQLLSREDVANLSFLYMNRIKELCETEDILIDQNIEYIEFIWLNNDEASYKEYLYKQIRKKDVLLRYLCKRTGSWSSSRGSGYTLDSNQYDGLIDFRK